MTTVYICNIELSHQQRRVALCREYFSTMNTFQSEVISQADIDTCQRIIANLTAELRRPSHPHPESIMEGMRRHLEATQIRLAEF